MATPRDIDGPAAREALSASLPATARLAPGPRGLPIVGSLLDFRRDVLALMLRGMREHGDVVRFRIGPLIFHLLCHPDDIETFFRQHAQYDKDTPAFRCMRMLIGEGVLVSNGAQWQRQRQLMQPTFTPQRMGGLVSMMATTTQHMLDQWGERVRNGASVDLASDMMRLTYRIIERALFSMHRSEGLDALEGAITTAMKHVYGRITRIVNPPRWLPTPANLRFRKAYRVLNQRVHEIIEQHRQRGDHDDLLTALMTQRSGQDAQQSGTSGHEAMGTRELRDQTITLLLAGHETTANALTWMWYLLSQNDDAQVRVHEEACSVLGDRSITAADLPRLAYTSLVFKESLRLYTPIWAIDRRVIGDQCVRGFHIAAGTRVVVSPYVTHRHPQFWDQPERFDPLRFGAERSKEMHPHAYIPFGGGPRYCLGQNLARTEALVIAAMVARRYRLRLAPGHVVEPDPGITLRARFGMRMIAEPWP